MSSPPPTTWDGDGRKSWQPRQGGAPSQTAEPRRRQGVRPSTGAIREGRCGVTTMLRRMPACLPGAQPVSDFMAACQPSVSGSPAGGRAGAGDPPALHSSSESGSGRGIQVILFFFLTGAYLSDGLVCRCHTLWEWTGKSRISVQLLFFPDLLHYLLPCQK